MASTSRPLARSPPAGSAQELQQQLVRPVRAKFREAVRAVHAITVWISAQADGVDELREALQSLFLKNSTGNPSNMDEPACEKEIGIILIALGVDVEVAEGLWAAAKKMRPKADVTGNVLRLALAAIFPSSSQAVLAVKPGAINTIMTSGDHYTVVVPAAASLLGEAEVKARAAAVVTWATDADHRAWMEAQVAACRQEMADRKDARRARKVARGGGAESESTTRRSSARRDRRRRDGGSTDSDDDGDEWDGGSDGGGGDGSPSSDRPAGRVRAWPPPRLAPVIPTPLVPHPSVVASPPPPSSRPTTTAGRRCALKSTSSSCVPRGKRRTEAAKAFPALAARHAVTEGSPATVAPVTPVVPVPPPAQELPPLLPAAVGLPESFDGYLRCAYAGDGTGLMLGLDPAVTPRGAALDTPPCLEPLPALWLSPLRGGMRGSQQLDSFSQLDGGGLSQFGGFCWSQQLEGLQ